MTAFNHPEAFCRMTYTCNDCGKEEIIWNSRDGVAPFSVPCINCKGPSMHVKWSKDECLPEHTPEIGSRMFIDLTPERAVEIVDMRIKLTREQNIEVTETTEHKLRELAVEEIIPGEPDLVEVTEDNLKLTRTKE